ASFVYGTGFLVAGLAQHWRSWYLGLIAVVSIAGGTVMTLAWGLLYKIVPPQHRGAVSGLATTTKGIGLLVGAPLAGLAIDVARPHLDATDGYQVLWPFCGLLILGAIPLLVHLMEVEPSALHDLVLRAERRFSWRYDVFCVMTTHFHLVLPAKLASLSAGMHWLNGIWANG